MANTVNIRKLVDGPRAAIYHVFFQGDGSAKEIVNQVIIDPSMQPPEELALVPPMGRGQKFSLAKVWYGLAGVDVQLSFENGGDPNPTPIWVLPAATLSGHVNFNEFGGISDKTGIDATGKLMFSTTGLLTTADKGSLIIKVLKHNDKFNPDAITISE